MFIEVIIQDKSNQIDKSWKIIWSNNDFYSLQKSYSLCLLLCNNAVWILMNAVLLQLFYSISDNSVHDWWKIIFNRFNTILQKSAWICTFIMNTNKRVNYICIMHHNNFHCLITLKWFILVSSPALPCTWTFIHHESFWRVDEFSDFYRNNIF